MDSTGPIGPRKLPKTAPIKLPESVAPAEPVALPPKPAPGGIVKDGLELTPHRTCKCAPGVDITPGKTLKGCMELPSKTIGRGCGIGIEPPTKTLGITCGVELPIKTAKICGIGPLPTQKCNIDLPDLPIRTLKGCDITLPKTMKCNIGPVPKTLIGCQPGPIEPPIKTAKICGVVPPHPPIRTCWCPSDPGGPIKTIGPIPGPSGPSIPIKTINPAPTPRCIDWPPPKPEQPVKTIDIIHNPAPTPKCKVWPPVNE